MENQNAIKLITILLNYQLNVSSWIKILDLFFILTPHLSHIYTGKLYLNLFLFPNMPVSFSLQHIYILLFIWNTIRSL